MNNQPTNHFRPQEKEILDSLPIDSSLPQTPAQSTKKICSFQNDIRWDINAVLSYRYLRYQETPFEQLTDGFIGHLTACDYCKTFLSLPLNEVRQAQQDHADILQTLRLPNGLILIYQELERKKGPAKSLAEIHGRRAPIAIYRTLDAISVQSRLEFLLAMMRLKVARVFEKFYFGQERLEPDYQYLACPRPEYPHETADRIDLVQETLQNGTMNAPESLTDYFEHAIQCETCQISLCIPDDMQDEVVITNWTEKIQAGQVATVIGKKELLKQYARSPTELEHVEKLFKEALKRAIVIVKSN